jgi:hypothetical protein
LLGLVRAGWLVDPDGVGQFRGLGWFADEAFGVLAVDVREDVGTHLAELIGEAEVHVEGRVHGDAGMSVGEVVPVEEALAPGAGVLDAAEPVGEVMPVFEGILYWLSE